MEQDGTAAALAVRAGREGGWGEGGAPRAAALAVDLGGVEGEGEGGSAGNPADMWEGRERWRGMA